MILAVNVVNAIYAIVKNIQDFEPVASRYRYDALIG